jgi:hypothetical protein
MPEMPEMPEAEAAPPAASPDRFPSWTIPTPEAIARAVAATRGGSSELALPGVPGPGGAEILAPLVESWYRPGGASDYRPGGASDYRPGGASDYRPGGASDYRPGGDTRVESWFRSSESDLERHGGAGELLRRIGTRR